MWNKNKNKNKDKNTTKKVLSIEQKIDLLSEKIEKISEQTSVFFNQNNLSIGHSISHQSNENISKTKQETDSYSIEKKYIELKKQFELIEQQLNSNRDELQKTTLELEKIVLSFSNYKNEQEKIKQRLLGIISNQMNLYYNEVNWYKANYEKNNLLNIIKKRI